MSKNAEVSWLDPIFPTTQKAVSKFRIIWKKDKKIDLSMTGNGNNFKLNDLKPFTKYEVFVSVGNANGFGKSTSSKFTTDEAAPDGPPLNLEVTAASSSSLSVTWEPPEKDKRNGKIVNYTVCISHDHIVCISHEETAYCFKKYITEKQMIVISNLNASTKYYVRVLASTKVGRGNYTESKGIFTNESSGESKTNCVVVWRVVVFSLSSFIIGVLLSCIVLTAYFRRRYRNKKLTQSNPAEQQTTSKVDSIYQDLDLNMMNEHENYQSLQGAVISGNNDPESNYEDDYTELKLDRGVEDKYQTLTST